MKVQKLTLERAIALLNAVKAKYKIIAEDGTEYGDLELAPKKGKRQFKYPLGEMSNYYRPMVEDMQPGDVRVVPAGKFAIEALRGTMTGWIAFKWGAGAAVTSVNRKNNTIEILRVS